VEAPTLNHQDKMDLLAINGTFPVPSNKTAATISNCCGTREVSALNHVIAPKERYITYQFKKPDQDLPIPTKENCLVIPDETGNLTIEWNNYHDL